MNFSSIRRLTSEHRSLQTSPLPPNYLHQPSTQSSDDITQFDVLLAGPQDTPYGKGVWRLHLKMPEDYPRSPPKASFRTRIWHPNVEENTGAVCVDTLKRDWKPELTIRDVLITISCLLIHPNPDSALNSSAGQLLQEDYESFARHARLMTSIHAPVGKQLKEQVMEATQRGEDQSKAARRHESSNSTAFKPSSLISSSLRRAVAEARPIPQPNAPQPYYAHDETESDDEENENDEASASKENDPSLSPTHVCIPPPSPRKNILGKRPLSSLPIPVEPDTDDEEVPGASGIRISSSERNIANNTNVSSSSSSSSSTSQALPRSQAPTNNIPRKSLKLSEWSKGINASGRVREDGELSHVGATDETVDEVKPTQSFQDGKENVTEVALSGSKETSTSVHMRKLIVPVGFAARNPASRNVSSSSASSMGSARSNKPRVGLRRL
ncbi:MAG: hypothetical protein M4579_002614 [Chaenotheca gracillima]|nr:MAG: hypothetical protein M4579_002614 [Chaenotheca gracillima]